MKGKRFLIFMALLSFNLCFADNYLLTKRQINRDGTVSIIFKQWNYKGSYINLHADSDLNNLCRSLGYLKSYKNLKRLERAKPKSPEPNHRAQKARFHNVKQVNEKNVIIKNSYEDKYRLVSFVCKTKQTLSKSMQSFEYEELKYDWNKDITSDYSALIINPYYEIMGKDYYLNENSNLNGVCQLFGFKTYDKDIKPKYYKGILGNKYDTVEISLNSKVEKLAKSNKALQSIKCL